MASQMWRVGGRNAVVYVEGREEAERVLAAAGRTAAEADAAGDAAPKAASGKPRKVSGGAKDGLTSGAMAVYSDRKGKPFAYQIAFDSRLWEAVTAALQGA